MWSLLTCVFLVSLLPLVILGDHFVSGLTLFRLKRRTTKREQDEIDFDNVDESLYGWEPQLSRRCPPGQYICRDTSYCFRRSNMCNNVVSCDDQSDEINAFCGYTTTPTAPPTTEQGVPEGMENNEEGDPNDRVQNRTNTSEETKTTSTQAESEWFNDPLIIAFICLGGAALILAAVAAIYCTKQKGFIRRPDSNQVTPTSPSPIDAKDIKDI